MERWNFPLHPALLSGFLHSPALLSSRFLINLFPLGPKKKGKARKRTMGSYYDIDAILTHAQKLPATFTISVPGLGILDDNVGGDVSFSSPSFSLFPLFLLPLFYPPPSQTPKPKNKVIITDYSSIPHPPPPLARRAPRRPTRRQHHHSDLKPRFAQMVVPARS